MKTSVIVRRSTYSSGGSTVKYLPDPREAGGRRQTEKQALSRNAKSPASSSRARSSREEPSAVGGVKYYRGVNHVCPTSIYNQGVNKLVKYLRHGGGGFSQDPVDFDSRISAICNLPAEPFFGAEKVGSDCNFHDIQRQIYTRGAHGEIPNVRMGRSPESAKIHRPPPEERQMAGQWRSKPTDAGGERSPRQTAKNKQRSLNFYGLAESRERSARRAAVKEVIERLTLRLQSLWHELRVPHPDQAYVIAAYLRGGRVGTLGAGSGLDKDDAGPTTNEVRDELVRQIALLLKYRTATIKVLRCIASRESRLAEVEQALQVFQWHQGRDINASGAVDALAGLRETSIDVVRAVLNWRTNLWQPRAFCWRGVNYLEKMSRDTDFLRSPVGTSLLTSIGLGVDDMTLVVFSCANSGGEGHELGRRALEGEMSDIRPPMTTVRLMPKAELVKEYRASFFRQSAGVTGRGDSRRIGSKEKTRIIKVVMKEPVLQMRVRAKLERLAKKGYFVPLLRGQPINGTLAKGGRRRCTTSSTLSTSYEQEEQNTNKNACAERHYADARRVERRDYRFPTCAKKSTPRPAGLRHENRTMQASDSDDTEHQYTQGEPEGDMGSSEGRDQDASDDHREENVLDVEKGWEEQKYDEQDAFEDENGVFEGDLDEWDAQNQWDKQEEQDKQKLLREEQNPIWKNEQEACERGGRKERGEQECWQKELQARHGAEWNETSTGFGGREIFRQLPDGIVGVEMVGDGGKKEPERWRSSEDTGLANVSLVNSQHVPRQTTEKKQEGREVGRRVTKKTIVASKSKIADTNEGVEFIQASSEKNIPPAQTWRANNGAMVYVTEKFRRPAAKRQGAFIGKRESEKRGSDVCNTGGTPLRGDSRDTDHYRGSGGLLKNQVSAKDAECPSRAWDVGGVDDHHCEGRNDSEENILLTDPEGGDEGELDRSVINELLYDDDFEEEGRDLCFTDSEEDDASRPSDSPSNGAHEEISKNGCVSTKADKKEIICEDKKARQNSDAFVIQRAWHRRAASNREKEKIRQRRLGIENKAVLRIQRMVRICAEERRHRRVYEKDTGSRESAKNLQGRIVASRAKPETQLHRMRTEAAIQIQSAVRGKYAYHKTRKLRRYQEAPRTVTAVKIQTLTRRGKAQASRVQLKKVAIDEKRAPSLGRDDWASDLTTERDEHREEVTQIAGRYLTQTSERGEGGADPSSWKDSPSAGGTEIEKRDQDLSTCDDLCAGVLSESVAPSAQAPVSRNSSPSLTSTGLRSPSSAFEFPSYSQSSSLNGSLGEENSSTGSSDNPSLLREKHRYGQQKPEADDDQAKYPETEKSVVGKNARPSERHEESALDEDTSKVQVRVVASAGTEDARKVLTTKLDDGVGGLSTDADGPSVLPNDNGRKDLVNSAATCPESDTAVSTVMDVVLNSTTNNVITSSPVHGGHVPGEASEDISKDIDLFALSSSSSSRRSV